VTGWWWRGYVGGVRGLKKFRLYHRERNLQRRRFALESRRRQSATAATFTLNAHRRALWQTHTAKNLHQRFQDAKSSSPLCVAPSALKFAQNKLGTLVKFYIPPLKLREKFAVLTLARRGGRNKFQLPFFWGRSIGNKLQLFISSPR
jgi:hypothetical protein